MWCDHLGDGSGFAPAPSGGGAPAADAPKGAPMPCSAADAPTAKDAFDKAMAGDMGGAMGLLSNLDGGMAGTCGACLLAQQSTPKTAMPECVGTMHAARQRCRWLDD